MPGMGDPTLEIIAQSSHIEPRSFPLLFLIYNPRATRMTRMSSRSLVTVLVILAAVAGALAERKGPKITSKVCHQDAVPAVVLRGRWPPVHIRLQP